MSLFTSSPERLRYNLACFNQVNQLNIVNGHMDIEYRSCIINECNVLLNVFVPTWYIFVYGLMMRCRVFVDFQ